VHGSAIEPLDGLSVVTRYAISALVSNTQNALRRDVVAACSFNQLGNLVAVSLILTLLSHNSVSGVIRICRQILEQFKELRRLASE
jgi:hypothetical protein